MLLGASAGRIVAELQQATQEIEQAVEQADIAPAAPQPGAFALAVQKSGVASSRRTSNCE